MVSDVLETNRTDDLSVRIAVGSSQWKLENAFQSSIFYRTDTLVSRLTIKVKAAKGIFTTVVTESAKAISEPRKAPRYRPALPVFHAEYGGQRPRRAQSARW